MQRRRMTRGVAVESMYDVLLRASGLQSVLIMYFPSCPRVAMTPYHLSLILYIERGRFTITALG